MERAGRDLTSKFRADQQEPKTEQEREQEQANRVTASLAGLAAALLMVVIGLLLVHHLYDEGRVEDCLMAGRSNCDQLVSSR